MNKRTRLILTLPLVLVVFVGVFWWNFPWESALRWGLTSAENISGTRGIVFSCDSSAVQDHVSPLFRCGDLNVHHAFGALKVIRAEARLRPLASVLNRGIYLEVLLGPGQFEALTGQKLGWTEGTGSLVVRRDVITVKDLNLTGDLSARGSLDVSPAKGRIVHAAVELTTPEEAETMIQALSGFMPLKRVKAGEWRLERK